MARRKYNEGIGVPEQYQIDLKSGTKIMSEHAFADL